MSMVEPRFGLMAAPKKVTVEREGAKDVMAWIEIVWPWHNG